MCKRLFCLVAIVSFSLSLSGQVNSDQKKATVDPAAMAALDKMGTYPNHGCAICSGSAHLFSEMEG